MKKMIIIGGGAAGMMTAAIASRHYDVTIIEKNEKLGKKLFITGKGRCNLTNDSDRDTFLENVISNRKFLYSAINSFDQSSVIAFFEENGLRTKTERGNRVFPVSDHSSDVIKCLEKVLRENKVKVLLNKKVTELIVASDGDERFIKGVICEGMPMYSDVVVLATGGLSYPSTGSTGDGFKMCRDSDIAVTKLYPALVPVKVKEKFVSTLMGLSLKNVSLKCILKKNGKDIKKDKILYEGFGEMLFTHFGVSGPLVLSASSYLGKYPNEAIELYVDLKSALSEEELISRIARDFDKFKTREYKNSLSELLPKSMIPVIIELSGISPEKKTANISSSEIKNLAFLLKHFKMNFDGLMGFDMAVITGGGVSVKEIDPKTMEAKKIKGLRFAGEIIDCDALTGGFNLQIAWSTAYMAAQ